MLRRTLLALACCSALSWAASADTLDNIKQAKVIKIEIDLSVPPWSFKDDKLNPTGSEVETARLLAKDLGAELEIVPTNGANRIPFLLSNRADMIISALSITPEREKLIAFSIPYSAAVTYVAAPKDMVIKGPGDLGGKRIAVTRGTTNDSDLTAMAPKDARIVRFEDEATTMTAVVSNQLELVAQAQSIIDRINTLNPSKKLEAKLTLRTSLFGIGMRKEDASLKQWVDAWVAKNLENGKLDEIYRKFQGAELPKVVTEKTVTN